MVSAGTEAVRREVPRIPDRERKEKERKVRFRGRFGKSPQCDGRFEMTFQQCCSSTVQTAMFFLLILSVLHLIFWLFVLY